MGSRGRHTGQQLPAGERGEAVAADEFFGREKRNQIGSQKSRAGNRTRDAGKRAGFGGVVAGTDARAAKGCVEAADPYKVTRSIALKPGWRGSQP